MEKHILMTGTGGYIGRHVVSALLELGQRVSVVDRRTEGIDPGAKIVAADVFGGDKGIYQKLGCPEVVVHIVWRDGFKHNSPAHINDLARRMHFIGNSYQGGLGQLVVMGTMHEVGHWEGAIDENSPCNPQSLYRISRNALRQFAFLAAEQNRAILQWVRTYYVVGDDLKGDSVFSKITHVALEGETRSPFTTGKNCYGFVSISELARQAALIVGQAAMGGIINVCSGQPQTLAQRVKAYVKENGYHINLDYEASPGRPYDSPGVRGNYHKLNLVSKAKPGY